MTTKPKIWIDGKHRYHMDGIKESMPSASTIAKHIEGGAGGLPTWAAKIAIRDGYVMAHRDESKRLADIGTAVHEEIETFIRSKKEPKEASNMFWNWFAYVREHGIGWIATEHLFVDAKRLYGGTVDAVGRQDGKVVLFDWKTTEQYKDTGDAKKDSDIGRDEHAVQMGGYFAALESDGEIPTPQKGTLIYIFRDYDLNRKGSRKVFTREVDLQNAKSAFMACHEVYKRKGGLYV